MEKIRLNNGREYALYGHITPHSIPIHMGGESAEEIIAEMTEANLSQLRFMTESGAVTGVYENQLMQSYSVSGDIVTVSIDNEDLVRHGLTLGEDGRIEAVSAKRYAPEDAVMVDDLPDGNPFDYRYVDGEYIYDPLPKPEIEQTPTQEERIAALEVQSAATQKRLDDYEVSYAEGVNEA